MRTATHLAVLTFSNGLCSRAPLFEKLGEPEIGPYCAKYLVKLDENIQEWSFLVSVYDWALCFLVLIIVRQAMMICRLCLPTEPFLGKISHSSSFPLHV